MTFPSWINGIISSPGTLNAYCETTSCLFNYPCSSITCTYYTINLVPGSYIFEVWGGKGGGKYNSGGIGGYSKGQIQLRSSTTLYIFIGSKGEYSEYGQNPTSSAYNGGGKGLTGAQESSTVGGGGGGTDIRLYPNSLHSRIIVSGGGGGEGYYDNKLSPGGNGGGLYGFNGTNAGSSTAQFGIGGNQNSPGNLYNAGSFGYGGNNTKSSFTNGGGGGGWYGGGSGSSHGSSGGGGSGYVFSPGSYIPSGYLLNSTFYLYDGETLPGSSCSNPPESINLTGNGAARITSLNQPFHCTPVQCYQLSHINLILFSFTILFMIEFTFSFENHCALVIY